MTSIRTALKKPTPYQLKSMLEVSEYGDAVPYLELRKIWPRLKPVKSCEKQGYIGWSVGPAGPIMSWDEMVDAFHEDTERTNKYFTWRDWLISSDVHLRITLAGKQIIQQAQNTGSIKMAIPITSRYAARFRMDPSRGWQFKSVRDVKHAIQGAQMTGRREAQEEAPFVTSGGRYLRSNIGPDYPGSFWRGTLQEVSDFAEEWVDRGATEIYILGYFKAAETMADLRDGYDEVGDWEVTVWRSPSGRVAPELTFEPEPEPIEPEPEPILTPMQQWELEAKKKKEYYQEWGDKSNERRQQFWDWVNAEVKLNVLDHLQRERKVDPADDDKVNREINQLVKKSRILDRRIRAFPYPKGKRLADAVEKLGDISWSIAARVPDELRGGFKLRDWEKIHKKYWPQIAKKLLPWTTTGFIPPYDA